MSSYPNANPLLAFGRPLPSALNTLPNQSSDRVNGLDITESGVSFSIPVTSRPTSTAIPEHRPPSVAHDFSSIPKMRTLTSPSTAYEYLIVMAGVVVTIQTQLLTSSSIATTTIPCAILSFGIISELLGALLAISFLQVNHHSGDGQPSILSLSRNCLVLGLPVLLILTGIAGLATVLVMEVFKVFKV